MDMRKKIEEMNRQAEERQAETTAKLKATCEKAIAINIWDVSVGHTPEVCQTCHDGILKEWETIVGTPPTLYVACHDGLATRRALDAAWAAFATMPEDTQMLIAEACRNVSCRCFCGFHGHSTVDSQKAHAATYAVCLHPGVWIDVDIEGDPGRTLVFDNASRFPSREAAYKALAEARTYRPFKKARVMPIGEPVSRDHKSD